jgi:hypothetical protein
LLGQASYRSPALTSENASASASIQLVDVEQAANVVLAQDERYP